MCICTRHLTVDKVSGSLLLKLLEILVVLNMSVISVSNLLLIKIRIFLKKVVDVFLNTAL